MIPYSAKFHVRWGSHIERQFPLIAVLATLIMLEIGGTLAPPLLAQSKPGRITQHQPPPIPDRAAVDRAIAMMQQVELAQTPISLKVTDASLQDISKQLGGALPRPTTIEVRSTNVARLTFELKNMPAQRVVQAVASLGGCKFYTLHDHWLLATENQLAPEERAEVEEWSRSYPPASHAQQVLIRYIAAALKKSVANNAEPDQADNPADEPLQTRQLRFGALSPDLQPLIQQLVSWRESPSKNSPNFKPLQLTPDTVITFDYDAQYSQLKIQPDDQAAPTPVSRLLGRQYTWQEGTSPEMRQHMGHPRLEVAPR